MFCRKITLLPGGLEEVGQFFCGLAGLAIIRSRYGTPGYQNERHRIYSLLSYESCANVS